TALCVFNVLFLLLCAQGNFASARTFSQLAVLGFMLLIGMVGGRVIPFFTARGLTLDHQVRTPRLDKALRVVSVLGMCGFALSQLFNVALNPGYLIVLAASIHLLRSGLWFNPNIRYIPLLWSLHLGYLLAAIGLLLCGLSFFIAIVRFTDALHLITLGGIGLTIL
ncbi:NnrS family protein, partial [Pseudoalteromonas ruthenica]